MFLNCQLEGSQSFFKLLTQISPFGEILGWNILVTKYPFGGSYGNSYGRTILIL
jgi:hypothetical protein